MKRCPFPFRPEIECVAAAVEADGTLNEDLRNWDTTIADGIDEYVAEHAEADRMGLVPTSPPSSRKRAAVA